MRWWGSIAQGAVEGCDGQGAVVVPVGQHGEGGEQVRCAGVVVGGVLGGGEKVGDGVGVVDVWRRGSRRGRWRW